MRGAWVARVVESPALDFGSGHDLMVLGIKPSVGLHADSTEPARDSRSLSLPLPYLCLLSLNINKLKKKIVHE